MSRGKGLHIPVTLPFASREGTSTAGVDLYHALRPTPHRTFWSRGQRVCRLSSAGPARGGGYSPAIRSQKAGSGERSFREQEGVLGELEGFWLIACCGGYSRRTSEYPEHREITLQVLSSSNIGHSGWRWTCSWRIDRAGNSANISLSFFVFHLSSFPGYLRLDSHPPLMYRVESYGIHIIA